MHKPTTNEGQRELMTRTATAHADAVSSHLRNLNCSGKQKAALIDAVISTAKQQLAEKVKIHRKGMQQMVERKE
ncbi:MAG: hypothetical protein IJE71_08845 [Clostridia bacterium]|nr:hypothetical protein [Clostridia bacterium]